jgi:hypothetical protein
MDDLTIGPNVKLYAQGWYCNIHLVRCKRVRLLDVGMFDVDTSNYHGDEHGKGLLLDNCEDVVVRDYIVKTMMEMGDGINVFNCRRVSLHRGTVIGLRRHNQYDTGAGVVIDKGSEHCTLAGLTVKDLGPGIAAATILGSKHVIKDVRGGVVQLGLDGQPDSVRDLRVLRCEETWVVPGAKGIRLR